MKRPNNQKKEKKGQSSSSSSSSSWQAVAVCMTMILIPWALYINFHPRFSGVGSETAEFSNTLGDVLAKASPATALGQTSGLGLERASPEALRKVAEKVSSTQKKVDSMFIPNAKEMKKDSKSVAEKRKIEAARLAVLTAQTEQDHVKESSTSSAFIGSYSSSVGSSDLPVLGPIPSEGATPLFGFQHTGGDAIFALACNYPKEYYQRFVGSLRKFGYDGDVVLAVSPPEKMKPGVSAYLKATKVLAYSFDVDCAGKDNCKMQDAFLGYPDPRPMRTFANIRYALYEYWLRQYKASSHILILDFRDTFFQANPFAHLPSIDIRKPKYELNLFAENFLVKSIGKCVYNSLWVGRCFGKDALKQVKDFPVLCSGSTMGSFPAVHNYVRTMLSSMDSVKCWLKGIESDQGYQNYLYYTGKFNTKDGNATVFAQGTGVVNTIGALNGHRVPKEMKGPLDTHWKIRDKEGFVLNYDGSKSACVHQWDRWYDELVRFIDTKLYDKKL